MIFWEVNIANVEVAYPVNIYVPGNCEDEIKCEILNFVFHRILNNSSNNVQIKVILPSYQSH